LLRPERRSGTGPLHTAEMTRIARAAVASALSTNPVTANDEYELAKTRVHGSSHRGQYDGIFCLFLGNDLIDLGEGEVSYRGNHRGSACRCEAQQHKNKHGDLHDILPAGECCSEIAACWPFGGIRCGTLRFPRLWHVCTGDAVARSAFSSAAPASMSRPRVRRIPISARSSSLATVWQFFSARVGT
jgi:hypothetical protein